MNANGIEKNAMKLRSHRSWSRPAGVAVGTAVAVLLLAGTATAQLIPATLDERITGAERVVVATARSVSARWATNKFGDLLIVSRILLEVNETIKGPPASAAWLDLEGGTLDGLTLIISNLPAVEPGERAVFFLESAQEGVFRPHLRGHGILKLDQNDMVQGTHVPLNEIRGRARGMGQGGRE